MEFIRDLIEWFANNFGTVLGTTFPFLMLGLVGLYVLWLVVGYLRVSQVGRDERREGRHAIALSSGDHARLEAPPGLPYCPVDGLQFPAGARFCTQCERDLQLDCASCGATLTAADASCYRCGTPTGAPERALLH